MSTLESGFRPEAAPKAVEAQELSAMEEVEQEAKRRKEVLLAKAQEMGLTPDAFVRKMMTGEIPHDPEDFELVMEGWEPSASAEFNANPETQSAALVMVLLEIRANRLSSALGIMDRFQISEAELATEEMQSLMKAVALSAMTRGDSSGSVTLVKRCKIDEVFLRSEEMRQAALACRGILAKKSSPSVVARRLQLERDFDFPPLE
ncbi:hypothetical protein A3C09_02685 [Candidatus Uhrbacteria bacterium RIFCSPHIGHO2_02_FULL_47_44]|uniref:Uncharacterized protein n=1 Tax=Candidatus Uhrbacteria bacterium RIFCSPLOWO2_02_FULL_48_18 TaxID=1802408 RepID=A0A1F7V7D7_9BACT|nr:MAG: hypothetical protein A2839_00085 [Candidatus Uhrbacteria bacterium RIFCSPHIGHO2_01_FULL_47_10]OGL70206.1 MAG: hypothetical protein A3C09_02685 [Candidatus Uhrbacteria bacterium RIFCSPHIGHO2_02_FULL_47_44]OGL77114.1 MAG: hypothetical protein A3E97_03430 [Candidatus Uhrbacteria bacterium RIFCSPHIGHO2_12_FULL_47_12]OGL80455.1 MAG: hypothetical protein A3B20_03530 [Candidatus Uhrbacteria bacterium RIFCSPLOWO2_01_FULL_47_17]OGL86315.1 MAG: hypothetical protein A3I41_02010 [Candidatus Uhrbact